MNSYIYEIINEITKEQYIGVRRCNCDIDKDKYKGENTIISKDFRKYGKKNFSKRILAVAMNKKMENILIELYMNHSKYTLIKECTKEELTIKKSTIGAKNGASRRVICLNTGEIFETISEASKRYNTDSSGIIHSCNPNAKQKFAGRDAHGNLLEWRYYDAYLAEQKGEKYDYDANKKGPKIGKTKPVRCIETGEIFNSIKEASERYGIHSGSISNSCIIFNNAGKHPDTGAPLTWEYVNKEDNPYYIERD